MIKKISTIAVATFLFAVQANATTTLRLDGYSSPLQTVNIESSPVSGTPSRVGAAGFSVTDMSGRLGSFTAWCLDVGHRLMRVGQSQDYNVTTSPFSNSSGLSLTARKRVQSVFDANYAFIDIANGDQAAGFQMALWEAAFEDDKKPLNMRWGLFRANSSGSTSLANQYLNNGINYTGNKRWNLKFLEVADFDANRSYDTGQNLVTVSPVPLPAAGFFLLTALAGTGLVARRRRKA